MINLFKRFLTPNGRDSMILSPPYIAVAIIVAAIFLPNSAKIRAEETRLGLCSQIGDKDDRLRCYDALTDASSSETVTPHAEPQPEKKPIATALSPSLEVKPQFGQKYLEREQDQPQARKSTYTLTGAYKNNRKLWTFEFENGEVWRQLETRYLSVSREFPVSAELSRGVFGSYNFRIGENGRPIKVKRLK